VLSKGGLSSKSRHPPARPFSLTVIAVSSFLKDAVIRTGDLADDGKLNTSFKT